MRKLLLFILFFGAIQAFGNNVILRGKITHPISDSVKVSYVITSIVYHPTEVSAPLQKDGTFTIAFDVPQGYTKLEIIHGAQQTEIFAAPGMDITMLVDANSFDSTLRYEGKGKEVANFMAKHTLERNVMLYFSILAQQLFIKEPSDFEAALKNMEQEEVDFLHKHDTSLPASFKDYFETYYRYKVYAIMELYPRFHEMRKQNSRNVKHIPKENYVVVDHIPLTFNDTYLDIESYQEYLFNLFAVKIAGENADDTTVNFNSFIETSLTRAYKNMPPKTAEFYASRTIYVSAKSTALDKLESEYREYESHFPHSRYLSELEKAISIRKTTVVGKPAIDFDINTPEGKKMKLSELKGQVVYIDFWSRSCMPCIAEMPDAKKVREHFKNKPVTFVYISLDTEDRVWKEAIKTFEVNGINTRVDKEWESDIVKKYGVKGIPSYFLIDKAGNFAVGENVARPSDTNKLIAQIENLLK